MRTKAPNIVIARPPRRTRPKPEPQPAPAMTISKPKRRDDEWTWEELEKRGQAHDRLFRKVAGRGA